MKIGFIGCGNMGGALALAVSNCIGNRKESEILVYDKNTVIAKDFAEKIGANSVSLTEVLALSDCIFLGVKPNVLPSVLDEIKPEIKERKDLFLISMAAGVTLQKIREYLGFDFPTIRIMPNTSVAVGKGIILYCKNELISNENENLFIEILKSAGHTEQFDESKIDSASAITGCGPAFAYMFISALADGGVASGLSRQEALRLSSLMLEGASVTAQLDTRHPEELKDAVCSPSGSTIEGVLTLEASAFRSAVSNAVINAYKKTKDLGK